MARRMVRAWTLAALVALPLLGGAPRPMAQAAEGAQLWTVQAGGDVPAEGVQTHAFYPRFLTIRAGDTVRWAIAGFMTVTFADESFLASILLPGPGAGEAIVGPGLLPAGPAGPDAVYSGLGPASSGLPFGPEAAAYQLTFPAPGRYDYVDALHPGVRGTIEVLPADAPLVDTPAQAAARGQAEYAQNVARVRSGLSQLRLRPAGRLVRGQAGRAAGHILVRLHHPLRELRPCRHDHRGRVRPRPNVVRKVAARRARAPGSGTPRPAASAASRLARDELPDRRCPWAWLAR